jgi:ankyrin repeat protein/spore coat protein CotH
VKLGQTTLNIGLVTVLCFWLAVSSGIAKALTLDDIFPTDRVLDVQITVADEDWDKIRYQARDFFSALHESRKVAPPEGPYTYVNASVTIDGVAFPQIGLRKKGFLGSQSTTRPSLKIKLNHTDKNAGIEGLTNLTLNNNQQDISLMSQFMGYALFNAVGSPAPRCAYARVTVNGRNLGVYSHVETVRKSFLRRAFGTDDGTLYEGPYVDFYEGWVGSFEHKTGNDAPEREKIQQLIEVLEGDSKNIEGAIGELVDLDTFYTFWAVEGLLGFWDGYSGNNNNFFIYLNPTTDKFHFLPWGADSLFSKHSKLRHHNKAGAPISVKTQGLLTHKLYQQKSGRERYAKALMGILEKHWNEAELLAEIDRIDTMVKPYLVNAQRFFGDKDEQKTYSRVLALQETRQFIRQRRADITKEIADGMPEWKAVPDEPFVTRGDDWSKRREKFPGNDIWSAAAAGNIKTVKGHLAKGVDINAKDSIFGSTALSSAALFGHTEVVALLLEAGADVNARNRDGGAPLHNAAFLGQYETVKLLLENGAEVNIRNGDGGTPSDAAAVDWETTRFIAGMLRIRLDREKVETGRTKVVELLRQHGATTNTRSESNALCDAVRSGDLRAVKEQVANGADINAGDTEFGVTALSWAALLDNTEIAKFLIEKGADVNAKSRDGSTPLHSAAFLGRAEISELLIQKGADVNPKNYKGETLFDVSAVNWEAPEFIVGLLEIKVDQEKVKTGRTKIIGILRQHGSEH